MSALSFDSFLPGDFNPSTEAQNAPSGDFEPIPDGEYTAVIKKAELKSTRDGTGTMLSVGVQVVGPAHANRWVWDNINVKNKSEAATRIGRAQFGALCIAAGFPSRPPHSPSELIGREVTVKVTTEQFNGKLTNRVKGWKPPVNGAPRSATAFTAPTQPTVTTAPKNPWSR